MSAKQCKQWIELVHAEHKLRDGSSWSVRCTLNESHDGTHEATVRWRGEAT